MASRKRKAKDSTSDNGKDSTPDSDKYFTWTDEETSLLLHFASSYKTDKTTEGKDWESVRTRYEDLLELFIERYPTNHEVDPEQFPNSKNTSVFTKEKKIAKFKRIKSGYKKAVDSGRRSGGGRVVTLLFDECSELWSGCPAVEAMDNGIETSNEISVSENPEEIASGLRSSAVDDIASDDDTTSSDTTSNASAMEAVEKTIDTRRNLIAKIKDNKNSKLTKKVTTENRMLALGQEELQLKKRMIDQLEKSEKKYTESMQSFAASLNSLSSTLQGGFNMLGMMMQQTHQQNQNQQYQNQQYNMHPQHQQQPDNMQGFWHLQDPSHFNQS